MPENWREHDPTVDHIVRIRDGIATKLNDDEWAAIILEPQLKSKVPEEVRNLFEVARGVLCYGCFFYPLYTLGSEQFYRVLEAALRHRCMALGAPKRINTFAAMLEWLEKRGILTEPRLGQWKAVRQLRNMSSHADRQNLYDPTMAVGNVSVAVELVNELLGGEAR